MVSIGVAGDWNSRLTDEGAGRERGEDMQQDDEQRRAMQRR
ncbi:hypothetical protein [Pseudomonas sp.]|nr:hypothetical protein [Pseudomonas sp.]MDU4255169.1 hypothetical protein [Pseudomonas sp.]